MKTAAIKIVRTYLCNGITGAVYTVNGARCAMLIRKSPYGGIAHVDETMIAKKLGVSLQVVSPSAAAKSIEAAGNYTVSVWHNPRKPEVRVYVKEGRKDRGFLAFCSEDARWNVEAGMAWGDAKKYAAMAGIAI
jgi:hypothetical protein